MFSIGFKFEELSCHWRNLVPFSLFQTILSGCAHKLSSLDLLLITDNVFPRWRLSFVTQSPERSQNPRGAYTVEFIYRIFFAFLCISNGMQECPNISNSVWLISVCFPKHDHFRMVTIRSLSRLHIALYPWTHGWTCFRLNDSFPIYAPSTVWTPTRYHAAANFPVVRPRRTAHVTTRAARPKKRDN